MACTASSSDEGDNSQDAISSEQANQNLYSLHEHLVVGEPASEEATSVLGIKTWDVYVGGDEKSGFEGSVIFGSDVDGDVKYGVIVDVSKASAGKVTNYFAVFDKAGKSQAMNLDSEKNASIFLSDIGRLSALVNRSSELHTSSVNISGSCVLHVGGAALGVVAGLYVGAVAGMVAGISIASGIGEGYLVLVSTLFGAGVGTAGGAAVGAVASTTVAVATGYWNSTVKACTSK